MTAFGGTRTFVVSAMFMLILYLFQGGGINLPTSGPLVGLRSVFTMSFHVVYIICCRSFTGRLSAMSALCVVFL